MKGMDLEAGIQWLLTLGLRRVLAWSAAAFVTLTGLGWAAATSYGKHMASSLAQELVSPVTNSLSQRVTIHDSILADVVRLQELSMYAQRRADPKYDSALKWLVTAGDAQRQRENEHRSFLDRLIKARIPTPANQE